MWKNISKIILNNRILIVFLILVLTVFFGFFATKIKLQYQINKLLPDNDSTFIAYKNFKSNFGQDGLMLVIATMGYLCIVLQRQLFGFLNPNKGLKYPFLY